jgi:hypothetical protein
MMWIKSESIEARPDVLEDGSGEPAGGEGVLKTYVEPPAGSPDTYNGSYGPRL